MRTACAVRYDDPSASTLNMFTSLAYACMCASIMPGMSVRPLTSKTCAPFALIALRDTSRILSPSTRTLIPSGQSALFPSKMRAFLKRRVVMAVLDWIPDHRRDRDVRDDMPVLEHLWLEQPPPAHIPPRDHE